MQDTLGWDKWIVSLIAHWLPFLVVLVAGLDKRMGWSTMMPNWVHLFGLALLAFGYAVGYCNAAKSICWKVETK